MVIHRCATLFVVSFGFLAVVPAQAESIQMLPPVQSGTLKDVCAKVDGNKVLSWDGSNPIKCQAGFVVDSLGNVGIATTPAAGWRLSVGTQVNGTGLPPFIVPDSGDIAVTGGSDSRWALTYISPGATTEKLAIEPTGDINVGVGNVYVNVAGSRVGVGTTSPSAKLDVAGGVKVGSDSVCNATKEGTLRYNSSSKQMEFCNGSVWGSFGGAKTYTQTGGWGGAAACGYATIPVGSSTATHDIRYFFGCYDQTNWEQSHTHFISGMFSSDSPQQLCCVNYGTKNASWISIAVPK